MRTLLAAATALAVLGSPAAAAPVLLAIGTLGGSADGDNVDLSHLDYKLENGLPQNVLGMGSGIAYAGGNTFYSLPDRGPNALVYNTAVDNTASYIARFQTVNLALTRATSGDLPFALTPQLTATTLLFTTGTLTYGTGIGSGTEITGAPLRAGNSVNVAGKNYFTGRSDNYDPKTNSGNPNDARFDPESIRVANDGKSVFVSDEYGPYVRQFDSRSGALIRTYALPAELDVATKSPMGQYEIDHNTVGRTANKGMEGLAITPDGKTLVGVMQANLVNDRSGTVRIVTIDVASGETHEFAYKLSDGSGISDIVAIDATHFLIDERDGKGLGDGSKAKVKKLYTIDLAGATDVKGVIDLSTVTDLKYATRTGTLLDLVAALVAHGISPTQIPSKIEGLAFGQDVVDADGNTLHTLFITNDNDFDPAGSGLSKFYVFGFKDGELAGFTKQAITALPEPATWSLMIVGMGLVGGAMRRGARRAAALA